MQTFTQLTIFLLSVILLSRLAALLSNRFGLPSISFQLLAGILIGPSLLNFLEAPIAVGTWGTISPSLLHNILKIIAEVGLIQLMFLAGLRIDWHELKADLKPIFSLSLWGFILTAMVVAIMVQGFVERWTEGVAIATVMATGSLGISVYHFNETGLLRSRTANLVLGSAILTGLLATLLMIAGQAMNYASLYGVFRMTIAVSWLLGKLVMFFAVAYFLTSRFLRGIAKTGFEKRPRQKLIGYLLLVAAIYAWGAMHFGSFAAVGIASLGGGLLGMTKLGLKEKIAGGFGSSLASLPMGILFVVLGMEANFKGIEKDALLPVVLLTVATTKLLGSWFATRKGYESLGERFQIMVGGLPQGEIGVLIAAYLFSRGLVNPSQFNMVITVVVLLTMISPMLMKIVGKVSLREVPQSGTTKQTQEIASPRSHDNLRSRAENDRRRALLENYQGRNPMPSYEKDLSVGEKWHVINYMSTLSERP
jgi:Kef-type K+ transport system membrane component KefB